MPGEQTAEAKALRSGMGLKRERPVRFSGMALGESGRRGGGQGSLWILGNHGRVWR